MSNLLSDENLKQNDYNMETTFNNEEIASACRLLGLSGPLEALLRGLRLESTPEHFHGKRDRRQEAKFDKRGCEYGQKSGQESWGKDSGARDLSPDHKIPASSGTDSQITENEMPTSSMLSLARKLQNAALSALKIEVEELSSRLRFSERERDAIQRRLSEVNDEKEQAHKRLQIVGSAHESRITELHCVIAELSKKLKSKQEHAIAEENEHEGSEGISELSFQEGSIYNSDMEPENYDETSRTQSIDDDRHIDENDHHHFSKELQQQHQQQQQPIINNHSTTNNSAQIQALQEEIIHLRVQLALLQSQLASNNDVNSHEKNINDDEHDVVDADEVDDDDDDDDEMLNHDNTSDIISYDDDNKLYGNDQEKSEFVRHSTAKNVKTSSIDLPPSSKNVSPSVKLLGLTNQPGMTNETPITKIAERVRLRRTAEEPHLTGTDLTSSGIFTTEVAEHLVSDLLQQPDGTAADPIDAYNLKGEIQRQQRRIDNLKFQNSVLNLTLAESKSHCEKLYLLCGKYESNAIALHQALNYCDRTIEGYDVLLALLESKVAILEGDDSAVDNQKITETVGKNLLLRLQSENTIPVNSVGPWQNTDGICLNNSFDQTPWTDEDYVALQNLVSKYKALRESVQNTCVQLEEPFYDGSKDMELCRGDKKENHRLDLETAVLMQEMMSVREEVGELKFRLEQTEKGKVNAEQRASALQEAIVYIQAQLDDTETLLAKANKNRPSYSESEHAAGIERELVEALARESRLKARLQCLTGALETAAKTSEEKYTQVQNTVFELKQSNLMLQQSLEKCKRKYQTRLKSLEQTILGIQMSKSQQSSHSSESHSNALKMSVTSTTTTTTVPAHQLKVMCTSDDHRNENSITNSSTTGLGTTTDRVPETTL